MRKMIGSIVAILIGAGLITGAGFYIVPKFIQKTTTKWTEFIDKAGNWIGANWVWFILIVIAVIVAVMALVLALTQRKK